MPVTIPAEVRGKFYALRALALTLGLFALGVFLLRPKSFEIESLGFLAIVVGAALVQRSNALVRRSHSQVVGEPTPGRIGRRVGRREWALTGASLVACVIFSLAMYLDAIHGGNEAWPAYALGGAVMALALTSGYVAMKIFR